MQVVHSERHLAHAHEHEVSMGRPIPAWEVPARAESAAIVAQHLAGFGVTVGILDVDYHHGNGTQQIFFERRDVAYASTRRGCTCTSRDTPTRPVPGPVPAPPSTRPLPVATSDDGFLRALERALDWLVDRTSGPLVVSLGLDTYHLDPIGDLALTTDGYGACGRLVAATGRPLVILQEGGCHVPSLGDNVVAWLAGVEERV